MYRGEWRAGMIHGCGVLLQRAAGAGDGFDVQEGKYLADEYVGPVMSCRCARVCKRDEFVGP